MDVLPGEVALLAPRACADAVRLNRNTAETATMPGSRLAALNNVRTMPPGLSGGPYILRHESVA